MVDQLVTAAALAVVFLAALYAHTQRLPEPTLPFWQTAAAATPALLATHTIGDAHVDPYPVLDVVTLSGGVILMTALTIPLALLAFSTP